MAELTVVATLKGVDDASPAFAKATASLGNFVKATQGAGATTQQQTGAMGKAFAGLGTAVTAPLGAIGKLAGAVGAGLGVAAGFQVFTSLGQAIGAAGGAAVSFEQAMAGVKAVSGATAPQMQQLSGLALQLGKDTAFSANEAAEGIGALVKGGVSVADVLGGSAAAALNLAAAGSVSVGEAAEIAATAMAQFGLSGADMTGVVDKIAGAANASTIEVGDFRQSLNQIGAVAKLAGVSFDDTATAIAVMGAAGIKGSDAGTSLRTMLLNLQPTTKAAAEEFKRLGIITADGSNRFFDATGKAKGLADVSQVLQDATRGMSEEQETASLRILFGTDAIRAASIVAAAGAAGFDGMAASMGKVTAQSVAMERLNTVAGDIEQLKGSLETAAIVLVGTFAPAFRPAIQAATELTNTFIQEAQTLIVTAQNIAGAHGIGLIPAALTAVELRIGEVFGPDSQQHFHNLRHAIEEMIDGWNGLAAATDHNAAIFRDAIARLDTSEMALATERNGVIFRQAWDDMAGSTTRNSQTIRRWMDEVGGPAWSGLAASNDRNAAAFRRAWDDTARSTETNGETIRTAMGKLGPAAQDAARDVKRGSDDAADGVEGFSRRAARALDTAADNLGAFAKRAVVTADDTNTALLGVDPTWEHLKSGAADANARVTAELNTMAENAGGASATLAGHLNTAGAAAFDPVGEAAGRMNAAVTGAMNATAERAGAFSGAVAAALNALGEDAWAAVSGAAGRMNAAVTGHLNALAEAAGRANAAVAEALNQIAATVAGLAARLAGPAQAAGASIPAGLAAGILGGMPTVVSAAVRVAQAGIAAARAALDAHSPSGEFEAIGETIPEGLVVGIEGGADDLIGAVEGLLADARDAAAAGTTDIVSAFDGLAGAIGAQFEAARGAVEEAQARLESDRAASVRRMHRDEELEAVKFNRRMADLQDELAAALAAPYAKAEARTEAVQRANERIEKAQEDHARRLEDLASANADRLDEIEVDSADRLAQAAEREALDRGKALRDYQRGLEELERDTAQRSAEIARKAAEDRAEAERDAQRQILDAQQQAAERILAAEDDLARQRALRARRDAFAAGQDAAALGFRRTTEDADAVDRQAEQRADLGARREESAADTARRRQREDADARYELERDLQDAVTDEQRAQLQERFRRQQEDTERRRRLDDEDRAYRDEQDTRALEAGFRKAAADLARRRAAEERERAFRAQQQADAQAFADALDDEALARTKERLEAERDERVRTITDALAEKFERIEATERKEQEALRKSYDQKAADLKERFVDKVGQLTQEALEALTKYAEEAANRAIAAMSRVSSVKPSVGGATGNIGTPTTWENQTQQVRDMFIGTYGAADAKRRWEEEHARELGVAVGTQVASGGTASPGLNAQGRVSGDTTGLVPGSAEWWAEENFKKNSGRAAGGSVRAGLAYPVGERGPETFIPWTDGMIAPAGAGLGGGWGGGIDYDRLADAIAARLGAQTIEVDGQTLGRVVRDQLLKHGARNFRVGLG